LNVGFSQEKFIVGLIFLSLICSFSSIFLWSLSLINDFINERETGCQKFGFSFVSSSSSSSSYLDDLGFEFEAFGLFSDLRLILGNEKLSE